MSKNEITRTTLRSVVNDMIELADSDKIPTIQEIKNIRTGDNLFNYLRQNYSPREYWMSGVNEEDLKRMSIQILGVHYGEFTYKIGINKNGVLPIIASLVFYMDLGFMD